MATPPDRDAIEQLVGTSVEAPSLYERALTHRSVLRGEDRNPQATNERLEFLGDALLGFLVGETLYEEFPQQNEGYLTKLRAKLVSGPALARYARRIDLGSHIRMSENAESDRGRENPSILADAYEALLGALYLDHGLPAARDFVHRTALEPMDLEQVAAQSTNHKSQLLEQMQAEGRPQPAYHLVEETGPSHDKTFTVEVVIGDDTYERGTAGSKKEAEQRAARKTLRRLASEHKPEATD